MKRELLMNTEKQINPGRSISYRSPAVDVFSTSSVAPICLSAGTSNESFESGNENFEW